jgi:hypothetical protein
VASFLSPLLRDPSPRYRLQNQRNGGILADRILTAFDSRTRRVGLLKHASLPDGEAMIIAPSNAIHTFFMKFAIDVAFVSRDGRVLQIRSRLVPFRLAISWRAYAVIEVAAGRLTKIDTVPGDRIALVQVD